jgi:hypothetical protein
MMSRDKLLTLRKRVKAGEILDRDQMLAVLDHGVQAYVEMEGGASAVEKRRELAERERQVGIALAQLREELGPNRCSPTGRVDIERARYTLDAIMEMLKAKGPAWRREWSWYAPAVEEEFGP